MTDIQAQHALSLSIATLLSAVIQENYHIAGEAIDIGSYGRGTNTDKQPDIDLLFINIPHDTQRGFVDWTPIDTFSLVGTWDGIQDLPVIQSLDPILFNTIDQSLRQLETIGSHARFCGLKAWRDNPEVVFTISLAHPQHGSIAIDVTLSYAHHVFGIEHTRRFKHYLQRIESQYGEERVQQLLADIRTFKQAVKEESVPGGQLDRRKKVSGFVIEALFLHQPEPLTYQDVIALLHNHTWSVGEKMKRSEYIRNQEEQLIDAHKSLDDVLQAATRGGYETLKTVAARSSQ